MVGYSPQSRKGSDRTEQMNMHNSLISSLTAQNSLQNLISTPLHPHTRISPVFFPTRALRESAQWCSKLCSSRLWLMLPESLSSVLPTMHCTHALEFISEISVKLPPTRSPTPAHGHWLCCFTPQITRLDSDSTGAAPGFLHSLLPPSVQLPLKAPAYLPLPGVSHSWRRP